MPTNLYDLTVSDVAERLGVHPDTIRRWSEAGKLPSWLTPGGQRRYRSSDVDALLPQIEDGSTEAAS